MDEVVVSEDDNEMLSDIYHKISEIHGYQSTCVSNNIFVE